MVESCERQATFLWQMSGRRYSDPAFLREGMLNYARFLNLMKLNPKAFAVPTYQIDLMWHTQMLASSAAYHQDAGALTGRRSGPDHDDSVNGRSRRHQAETGPALVGAAVAKSTGVVSQQQPVSSETLLYGAIYSDTDVDGAVGDSIVSSMAECIGMGLHLHVQYWAVPRLVMPSRMQRSSRSTLLSDQQQSQATQSSLTQLLFEARQPMDVMPIGWAAGPII